MEDYKSKGFKRDVIDSFLTYVNKDLLICKLFYFFFFAAFGSLYPLLAIYFKQLGMNATQSGILIGFRPFIEFCSAPFWGGVADKIKKWRQLMLFSVFCWITFTLAMAFVKPPAVSCTGDLNITEHDVINIEMNLIKPAYSTVFYKREDVKDAFFALLLIIVVGEFFSAPAITFADSVTLSYLGEDTDNYGRQRMFGSLGWGLSMFFVGMALDHSTTFPEHPCEKQHHYEKNYIICFAVFSVLMSCAFITATQFKFPGQENGRDRSLPRVVLAVKDKVKETLTGVKKIDREKLVEEDGYQSGGDNLAPGSPGAHKQYTKTDESGMKTTESGTKTGANGKPLQISLESKTDMVTDVINSPGAMAPPPEPDEPFLGRWMAVIKLLAQLKFVSVLFVAWFMGFGIGLIFTFLFWHLQDLGGSPTLFGVASVINHISELLAYFLCSRFVAMFGHMNILYAGLVGNIARFMYISWLRNPYWVLPFEFVQGLTHAAVWATTCSYITQAIPLGLRSSAQGILQGLHHGLGRGCGAVFGGILVYSCGSAVTFRAYGVTCIFVLVAFFGSNYFLKLKGIPIDSHVPHEVLEEEQQYHIDPHGVPSGIARDLSSSRLNKEDERVTSYGATLGTNARDNLEQAFSAPPSQEPQNDFSQQTGYEDDFSHRQTFNAQHDDYTSSSRDTQHNVSGGQETTTRQAIPYLPQTEGDDIDNFATREHWKQASVKSGDREKEKTDAPRMRDDHSFESRSPARRRSEDVTKRQPGEREESSGRRRRQSGNYEAQREREDHRQQQSEYRRHRDDARDYRDDRQESKEYREESRGHKERRRRQSGDLEGQREREDHRGPREEHRSHRRHSKKRGSLEGSEFQDFDPNPKEQIVFEKLPDLSSRSRQPPDSEDTYRPY